MEYLITAWEFLKEWYWIPLGLAYLGVIISILLENRNSNKAISYILVLLFLPVVGLLVFYFFGRDFRKREKLLKKEHKDFQMLEDYWKSHENPQNDSFSELSKKFGSLSMAARMLYNQHESFLMGGNEVQILKNGEDKFPTVFAELEKAIHHIHLEYYIFTCDDVGNRVAEILINKARQGVEVRVVLDGAGSGKLGNIPKRFKEAGIQFYEFLPVRFSSLAAANYRNHRKSIIIDGRVGFIGGLNMDDRYWNNGKHDLYWRDTHLMIQGPAVNMLQLRFNLDWTFVSKKSFAVKPPYFAVAPPRSSDAQITIASSGPSSDRPFAMDCLVSLILNAKKFIKITNPYFIPNEEIKTALIIAATSGIRVELLVPKKSDSFIVQHASFSYLKPLLENKVIVHRYTKGFVHAKTLVIDESVAVVGTVNMDIRSFYINFEAMAIVYHEPTANDLSAHFESDKKECEILTLEHINNRSFSKKILDSLCRLITPLL